MLVGLNLNLSNVHYWPGVKLRALEHYRAASIRDPRGFKWLELLLVNKKILAWPKVVALPPFWRMKRFEFWAATGPWTATSYLTSDPDPNPPPSGRSPTTFFLHQSDARSRQEMIIFQKNKKRLRLAESFRGGPNFPLSFKTLIFLFYFLMIHFVFRDGAVLWWLKVAPRYSYMMLLLWAMQQMFNLLLNQELLHPSRILIPRN